MKLVLAVAMVLVGSPALAQQPTHVLRGNGEKAIAVWRSESAADSGGRLVNAGQPDLARKYIACAVPPGTKVVILPGGYNTHRIMVIDGQFRGCEGNILAWDLRGDKAQKQQSLKNYLACEEKPGADSSKCLDEWLRADGLK